jgi:uncharacterized glyoxalase superfamily protein PhnB
MTLTPHRDEESQGGVGTPLLISVPYDVNQPEKCHKTGGVGKESIEKYFSRLSEGGSKIQPIQRTFFGWYGDFKDKFGVNWMFQADNPK